MFDLEKQLITKRNKIEKIYLQVCEVGCNRIEKAYWLWKYKKAIKQVNDYVNRYGGK